MRADNVLRGKRHGRAPYIEVKPSGAGLTKLATLARIWQRSYLYESPANGRVILAADELEGLNDRLLAVMGNLTKSEIVAFLSNELAESEPLCVLRTNGEGVETRARDTGHPASGHARIHASARR